VAAPNSVELIGFSAPVAPGEGSSPVFAAEAQAYFTAAEAQGATFNQTSIDPIYTEEYVKTAINRYVVGLKADGLWDKMALIPLFCGSSFEGLSIPLKGNQMVLYNFTSADYKAVGTGAGLKGDGTSKYINTNLQADSNATNSRSFSFYATYLQDNRPILNAHDSNYEGAYTNALYLPNSNARYQVDVTPGYWIGSRRNVDDVEFYQNGVSIHTDSSSSSFTGESVNWYIYNVDGGGFHGGHILLLLHIGSGLSDVEVATFSTLTNTLMTELGCNVY
jgi:hypothetical protein